MIIVEALSCLCKATGMAAALTAETIYRSFNFKQPWEQVRFEDVWVHPGQTDDLRLLAPLEGGKVNALFPRIG